MLAPAPRTRYHPAATEYAGPGSGRLQQSSRCSTSPLRSSTKRAGGRATAIKDAKLPLNPTPAASHGRKTRNIVPSISMKQKNLNIIVPGNTKRKLCSRLCDISSCSFKDKGETGNSDLLKLLCYYDYDYTGGSASCSRTAFAVVFANQHPRSILIWRTLLLLRLLRKALPGKQKSSSPIASLVTGETY